MQTFIRNPSGRRSCSLQRILGTIVCVKRSVRLSSKGIDRWRGSFFERGAERSVETLREMRNRSCACGRPASPLSSPLLSSSPYLSLSLSLFSVSTGGLPLQHLLPVSRSARFAYLPETRRRYSSHVLDPRRRRFTVSNKLSSSSSSSSFFFSFFLLLSFLLSILVLPLVWHLVCPWTDAVHS